MNYQKNIYSKNSFLTMFKKVCLVIVITLLFSLYGNSMDNTSKRITILDFIKKIESLPPKERQAFVEFNFNDVKNSNEFPITTSNSVIFIYKDKAKKLFL